MGRFVGVGDAVALLAERSILPLVQQEPRCFSQASSLFAESRRMLASYLLITEAGAYIPYTQSHNEKNRHYLQPRKRKVSLLSSSATVLRNQDEDEILLKSLTLLKSRCCCLNTMV